MLKELSLGPRYDFDLAVRYSRDVLKRPWSYLEPLLVGLVHSPDLIRLKSVESIYFVRYARYHNGSPTLKQIILAQGSPAAAFAYAAYGTRHRWPEAEDLILSGDTAESPALCMGVGDFLDVQQWSTPWESQAVTYARLFLKSGWPVLEDKMARGECHPQVAYEYAVNVLQGPLPQAIANWLMLESFDAEGKKYQQGYIAFSKTNQSQPSMGNPSSPPP